MRAVRPAAIDDILTKTALALVSGAAAIVGLMRGRPVSYTHLRAHGPSSRRETTTKVVPAIRSPSMRGFVVRLAVAMMPSAQSHHCLLYTSDAADE